MEEFLLSAANSIVSLVGTAFNFVFFWLPVDPLADYLNNADVQAVAGQGVRWLNWFVDVRTFSVVLSTFVSVLLLFAAYKVFMVIVHLIANLVEAVKPF